MNAEGSTVRAMEIKTVVEHETDGRGKHLDKFLKSYSASTEHSHGQREAPIEIKDSLARFHRDHPDQSKTAFILMKFDTTAVHDKIRDVIKAVLAKHKLTAVRADDREYHKSLLPNVETYLWGCGFGVAVFERITSDDFNPNVGLEVGYMMALRKDVCLLKDRTLKHLQTDLIGELYRPFDVHNIEQTITEQLEAWMKDKGIIK